MPLDINTCSRHRNFEKVTNVLSVGKSRTNISYFGVLSQSLL